MIDQPFHQCHMYCFWLHLQVDDFELLGNWVCLVWTSFTRTVVKVKKSSVLARFLCAKNFHFGDCELMCSTSSQTCCLRVVWHTTPAFSARLQSAAAKQERQFQSMRRAFDLKDLVYFYFKRQPLLVIDPVTRSKNVWQNSRCKFLWCILSYYGYKAPFLVTMDCVILRYATGTEAPVSGRILARRFVGCFVYTSDGWHESYRYHIL